MLKRLCQCIGLSSLILVVNYGDLLGGGSDVRMHYPRSLTGVCLASIADILLLGVAIFLILRPLERTRAYRWVRLVLAIAIPPYLLVRTQSILPLQTLGSAVPLLMLAWGGALLMLMLMFPVWYRVVMRFASGLAACFAIFAFSSILQLLWIARWRPGAQQIDAHWSQQQPPRQHPRLIWVVFDELSYDQVYEHRAKDLPLPSFDALRDQSTVFTNVQPSGIRTVKVIPSLFTGRVVDDFRYSLSNQLKVHYTGVPGWHPVTGRETVFGDAKAGGWRTAAVGWYNPYCTLYGDSLDQCYWSNHDKMDGPMVQSDPIWRNVARPFVQMAREIQSPSKAERELCTLDVQRRLVTHLDLEQHSFDVLHGDQADFVYLHLAIPHSPNIWSRINDNYTGTCDSSYLDSLALADRELGRMMTILQGSPRWKDTTVIIQGDHSWRTEIWDGLPAWTEEDDAASRDVFDPRPALIIHQPGQSKPEFNNTPWPLVQVHEVIEQTLKGQPVHY
ncbi:sulfatase-like hydrolase/transferase [Granulicella sp. WH15]|uniref:sulfatase-like hydrolase/transferase n=1 Tax=Granulicella sp. WH15 TaxID=2602070 RepID=UPI0013A5A790|nr:sulfatase-like hydrolase/transferase [Granulicella sp. WH15]